MTAMRESIIEKISTLQGLPSLDINILEISNAIFGKDSEKINFKEIAKIIERDIGLTAKVLQIANSTYYAGRYGKIGNISQSISRLGLKQVADICLAISSMNLFPHVSNLIDISTFWRHSISVAMVTRDIADKSPGKQWDEGNVYIAGLFHDIGILILDTYFSELYKQNREAAEKDKSPVHILENRTFGIDHGEIGGLMLQKWNFPEEIIQAVSYHHYPQNAPEQFLAIAQLVHLSDFSCSVLGIFEPGDSQPEDSSFAAWEDLGLDMECMQNIIEKTEEEIDRSGTFVKYGL